MSKSFPTPGLEQGDQLVYFKSLYILYVKAHFFSCSGQAIV